ncbi:MULTISPECIES: type II and III secretion system protein family protein [unclassified Massilia]|uniref:type II and III secretion system protein family protein n=1 Tax=unclassified Massilia TaxID=2609279 RepID=UPI000A4E4698|nr:MULTISPECIES: type II and III secretion system protein family protein [unclassified Massilia]
MRHTVLTTLAAAALCCANAAAATSAATARHDAAALRQCTATQVEKPSYVTLGKSTVVMLPYAVIRMAVGGAQPGQRAAVAQPAAAPALPGMPLAPMPAPAPEQDGVSEVRITLLAPTELFVLGRKTGAMNVILQDADGRCHLKDIVVTVDPEALQSLLADLVPDERGIRVKAAENSLVLTGEVSDPVVLDQVLSLAASYGDGKKVVNLLHVAGAQQVMLEVKIAEVSKTLLDKLGSSVGLARSRNGGTDTFSLLSNFLSEGGGFAQAMRLGRTTLQVDGQKDDGLVRVLAEPNIMAVSGQQASFLSGGKIFIPVARDPGAGGFTTITLEEKEFGIGIKFTPTVLGGSRVNLKMVSEVSDLAQAGNPFVSVNGVTSVLPSFTVRRADTTVQLNDGQSFVIAGLIKNNTTETVKRFPGLGEIPVLGALFRSSEFQKDQTELMFVVTPRLVKPLAATPRLPTDNHVPPTRADVYLNGSLERSEK